MRKFHLFLITMSFLALTTPAFSQTMSNTDQVITLTNTCINGGITNGTYTLELNYFDLDQNTNPTVLISGVSVAVSGGVMTITAPAGTFPSVATKGWWSLPDAWPGHIKLTSGNVISVMYWYQNPDGSTGFNCVALPVDYNSFSANPSGSQVVLNWQTGLEQNSTVFEVYRWTGNAGGYYKIGQVAASGNSSIPVNYTFTDLHPCTTNTYYLKMLNSQGTQPIFSGTASAGCSSCTCSLPSPVNCNFSISGPDHICNVESLGAYTLSSAVPDYSTIAWSVDQPSVASVRSYSDFDRTKASLLKKTSTGGVTLKATISGCTNVISKFIVFGTPDPVINGDLICPYVNLNMSNTPGATNFSWVQYDVSGPTQSWPNWGANQQFYLANGDVYAFTGQYTNACGTSNVTQVSGYWCPVCGNPCGDPPGDGLMAVSPNPSNGLVSIALTAAAPSAGSTARALTGTAPAVGASASAKPKVYQVQVVDVAGVVRRTYKYPGGMDQLSLDLSALSNGVYILRVYDGRAWRTSRLLLTK